MSLVVGCPCGCEGVLSAGEVCRSAEFIQSPQQMLGAALYGRRLGRASTHGSFGCSQMLRCRFTLQQQLNSDIKPRHS